MTRRILALAALATCAALWASGGSAAQSTCRDGDVACRLDRIEARLSLLEQRAASSESPGVSMRTNSPCNGDSNCQRTAGYICRDSGFRRGVPDQIEHRNSHPYLVRATCLD